MQMQIKAAFVVRTDPVLGPIMFIKKSFKSLLPIFEGYSTMHGNHEVSHELPPMLFYSRPVAT
jgi:hypothetical protein